MFCLYSSIIVVWAIIGAKNPMRVVINEGELMTMVMMMEDTHNTEYTVCTCMYSSMQYVFQKLYTCVIVLKAQIHNEYGRIILLVFI